MGGWVIEKHSFPRGSIIFPPSCFLQMIFSKKFSTFSVLLIKFSVSNSKECSYDTNSDHFDFLYVPRGYVPPRSLRNIYTAFDCDFKRRKIEMIFLAFFILLMFETICLSNWKTCFKCLLNFNHGFLTTSHIFMSSSIGLAMTIGNYY